jgi:hypothetical protein
MMIVRICFLPWILVVIGWYMFDEDHTPWVLLVAMAIPACGLWCFSIILRIFGWFAYRNDPDNQQFLASGGDPYFDLTLPWPFNPDSLAVRLAGRMQEPNTSFVPPEDWLKQCRHCGARNEQVAPICWHCGHPFGRGVSQGRELLCWNCGDTVIEPNYGDLENGGVICPHCNSSMGPPGGECNGPNA